MSVGVYVHMNADVLRAQKNMLDPLELEFEVVVC